MRRNGGFSVDEERSPTLFDKLCDKIRDEFFDKDDRNIASRNDLRGIPRNDS